MFKFVVLSVFIVALARQSEAFGVVRVDVQKDPAFVNAVNNAITSKIQSWNSILNSLLQIKSSYAPVSSYGSSSGVGSTTSTVAYAPLFKKIVTFNSGVVSSGPSNGRVAASVDDSENEVTSAATTTTTEAVAGGSAVVTVNKSAGIPSAAVLARSSPTTSSSGSASVFVKAPVVYTYSKGYVTA